MGELEELIRRGSPLITIEGDEGIGKSATAIELGRRLHEPGPGEDPPDLREHNFLWVPCEGGCPDLREICGALARLTGDRSLSSLGDDEKLDALRIHMSLRKTVLLLDDLHLSEDKGGDIRRLLSEVPRGSYVIASLNRPLDLKASRVFLPRLEAKYIKQLTEDQARSLNLELKGGVDSALANHLEDVAKGNPGMVEWLLRSFDHRAGSLEAHLAAVKSGKTLPDRFVSSWSNLNPREQLVLGACSFIEGSATAAQIATACDLDEDSLGAALESLSDTGLLMPVHRTNQVTVYTCSERLARFAMLKTPPTIIDEFTDRLLQVLKEHFAQGSDDASATVPHLESLRAVMKRLAERGRDDELQELFQASFDILFTLGRLDDRILLGWLCHESARAAGNDAAASHASEVLSSTYVARGEIELARKALAVGQMAARDTGSPLEEARQMRCAALVSYRSGEMEQALADIEGAEQLASEAGDPHGVVNILAVRSAANRQLGRFDDARVAAEAELRICEEQGWHRGVSYPLRDLAEISLQRRRFVEAREQLQGARRISAANGGDLRQLARISLTEANLCLLEGRLDEARRLAAVAQAEASRLGLSPEPAEARAIFEAARRTKFLPFLRLYHRLRPLRLSGAPV
ncbi:MAG TPA: hypothetical protein VNC16_01395 [Solirubrobacterales bacterium]|nr:hypothetical protein [Solirubrobacterales bacterium]